MANCPNCNANLPQGAVNCPNCGAVQSAPQNAAPQQPVYQQPPVPQPMYQQPYGAPPSGQNNTGMLVWSIINIFLCTILGIIALVFTLNAKNATTGEDEQSKLKTAKILNIIGTIGGVLLVVFGIIYVMVVAAAVGNVMGGIY